MCSFIDEVYFPVGHAAALTNKEMALLISTERKNISRLRQERAGISDAQLAYRDSEIEPFLQPLHEPHAWPEYYPMDDPVVAPESDEEEVDEDEEDQWNDVPLMPWIMVEYVPHKVSDKLRGIFNKNRTLIRAPRLQIQGRFNVIGHDEWDNGKVYCLQFCGERMRLLLIVTQIVPERTYDDISGLKDWARTMYWKANPIF